MNRVKIQNDDSRCSDLTFLTIFTIGVSVNIFSALGCFLLIIFHLLSWVSIFAFVLLEQCCKWRLTRTNDTTVVMDLVAT